MCLLQNPTFQFPQLVLQTTPFAIRGVACKTTVSLVSLVFLVLDGAIVSRFMVIWMIDTVSHLP